MLRTLLHVYQLKELRNKLLFTLGMLAVYRIGFWIPPAARQRWKAAWEG